MNKLKIRLLKHGKMDIHFYVRCTGPWAMTSHYEQNDRYFTNATNIVLFKGYGERPALIEHIKLVLKQ